MRVDIVAQQMMDRYYQALKSDSDFLELYHFMIEAIAWRDKSLEDEYKATKFKLNSMLVDPAWAKPVRLKIQYDKEQQNSFAKFPYPIFTFPLDDDGMGVQQVNLFGVEVNNLKRIKINQKWELKYAKQGGGNIVWYWVEGQELRFYNLPSQLVAKNVVAQIIPASNVEDDGSIIPDGKVAVVMTAGLNGLFDEYQRRTGKIIMLNDKNQNPSDENANVYKGEKTT